MHIWFPVLISAAVDNPDKFSLIFRKAVLSGNPAIRNPYKNSRKQICRINEVWLYIIYIDLYRSIDL